MIVGFTAIQAREICSPHFHLVLDDCLEGALYTHGHDRLWGPTFAPEGLDARCHLKSVLPLR